MKSALLNIKCKNKNRMTFEPQNTEYIPLKFLLISRKKKHFFFFFGGEVL